MYLEVQEAGKQWVSGTSGGLRCVSRAARGKQFVSMCWRQALGVGGKHWVSGG